MKQILKFIGIILLLIFSISFISGCSFNNCEEGVSYETLSAEMMDSYDLGYDRGCLRGCRLTFYNYTEQLKDVYYMNCYELCYGD